MNAAQHDKFVPITPPEVKTATRRPLPGAAMICFSPLRTRWRNADQDSTPSISSSPPCQAETTTSNIF